ncbi:MAG: formate dehydrogenase accessory protein FdhE [Desulfovibrio sp.]|nr:formate dehydrogenase accessory protein FdhE [Desulfovibrio sp.]MBR4741604.1 formate dehydrogenase accessory protein FdhE [Desulfovibrio sp.]
MQAKQQTAEQTLKQIISWRPALSSFLQTLSPLLMQEDLLCDKLAKELLQAGLTLPMCSPTRMQQGSSLLSDEELPDLGSFLFRTANSILPTLEIFPNITIDESSKNLFADMNTATQKLFFQAITGNNATLLTEFAAEKSFDVSHLLFLAHFPFSILLKALVHNAVADLEIAPWDENNVWQQGYCPVCGSYPTIGWLDKPVIDERNTYLIEGGGKKHLHCGVCGANWRFIRIACPHCGINKSKHLEILTEEENTHGESLDWCEQCHFYCPIVDLRERLEIPHLDTQAIGMLHLAIIAKEKQLAPLRVSFWNNFSS